MEKDQLCRKCGQVKPVCCGSGRADDEWCPNTCFDCCRNHPYRVGRSPIHGIGVFAGCSYSKGDVIGQLETVKVGTLAEFKGSLPITGLVHNGDIMAVLGGFPFWYVNSAEDGNIVAMEFGVVADRDIKKGEELTLIYYK